MTEQALFPDLIDQYPDFWPTKRVNYGDTWQLGRHKLMCWDSRDKQAILALLQWQTPALIVTDPPYGINYSSQARNNYNIYCGHKNAKNDRLSKPFADKPSDIKGNLEGLFIPECPIIFTWYGTQSTLPFYNSFIEHAYEIKQQIIWYKSRFSMQRTGYHWQYESALIAVKIGSKMPFYGDRKQGNVWEIGCIGAFEKGNSGGISSFEDKTTHSNQKPLECMYRPIRLHSREGELIYDPFAGSGTTLIACEVGKRKCVTVEIVPEYCDMIIARWEHLTKQMAVKLS